MFHFPDLDAMVALWGGAVLTYATVRSFFFDSRIQIDLPPHRGRGVWFGRKRN